MGRYYSGDIEGKFWFGVQSSTSAGDRFGCEESCPEVVDYYADKEHLPMITTELSNIEAKMGDQLPKYDEFFNNVNSYSEKIMVDAGLDPSFLEDYADYRLGVQIQNCIIEQGSCSFIAEL
jgi:hypothetical protein